MSNTKYMFKCLEGCKIYELRNYQIEALEIYRQSENPRVNNVPGISYNKNGIVFKLKYSEIFQGIAGLFRENGDMSGLIGPLDRLREIDLFSARKGIETSSQNVVPFMVEGDSLEKYEIFKEKAERDTIIEYAGYFVEIRKGDTVYKDNGKIITGWHGSYNPPHGM